MSSAWTMFRWTRRRLRRCRTPGRSGRTAGSRKCEGKEKNCKIIVQSENKSVCSKRGALGLSSLSEVRGQRLKDKNYLFQVQVQHQPTVKGQHSVLGRMQCLFRVLLRNWKRVAPACWSLYNCNILCVNIYCDVLLVHDYFFNQIYITVWLCQL